MTTIDEIHIRLEEISSHVQTLCKNLKTEQSPAKFQETKESILMLRQFVEELHRKEQEIKVKAEKAHASKQEQREEFAIEHLMDSLKEISHEFSQLHSSQQENENSSQTKTANNENKKEVDTLCKAISRFRKVLRREHRIEHKLEKVIRKAEQSSKKNKKEE